MPSRRPPFAALCLLAAALPACSKNDCLVTTTGAASSSMECSVTATQSAEDVSTLVISVPGAIPGHTYFSFKVTLGQAAPAAITYTNQNTTKSGTGFGDCADGAGCFIQFSNQKNARGDALPDIGTFSVAVSRVDADSGGVYVVAGTAEMTLVPSLGNGAGVSAKVKF